MKARAVAAILLAAALVGGAAPKRVGHCGAGETALYSCAFGRKHASVCAAPGRIAYRYGPLDRPELTIASTPDWSNVRLGRVTGGGGGYQTHLRFTAAGHDYLVHQGVAGSLTDHPGQRWSGVVVQRGDAELASLSCRQPRAGSAAGLEGARDFAPAAALATIDDTDPRFDAWF